MIKDRFEEGEKEEMIKDRSISLLEIESEDGSEMGPFQVYGRLIIILS